MWAVTLCMSVLVGGCLPSTPFRRQCSEVWARLLCALTSIHSFISYYGINLEAMKCIVSPALFVVFALLIVFALTSHALTSHGVCSYFHMLLLLIVFALTSHALLL